MSAPGHGFLREALFNGNGVAKRLIVALVLFSSLVTAVITALELYVEYRRDVRQIDSAFEFVGKSYLPSLVDSVWVADGAQVQTQLDGLLNLPDIEYIGVLVEGRPRWSAGQAVSARTRSVDIALLREHRGGTIDIGTVRMVASVDRVLDRMWDRLLLMLASNAVKTLLVALFLLLVFQWLVTRHLVTIAGFLRTLDPKAPRGERVALARPAGGRWRPDVLDAVTDAINGMSQRLAAAQADLREGEARFRAIVEAQDDAVCRWRPDTTLTYANANYCALFGLTESAALGRSWLDFVPAGERAGLAAFIADLVQARRRAAYEHPITLADGSTRWYSWVDVPLFDRDGSLVEYQSVGRDVTERRRADEALRRAHRALGALSACNQAMLRARDETTLLHEVCRIGVEHGGYRMAWIGMNRHDAEQSVVPVAAAGDPQGYLASIRVSWGDNERGRGPTGTAIRTQRPAIARDILNDPHFAPWREAARRHGFSSSIALPLLDADGTSFGALNLYASEPDAFDDEEVRFLGRLAEDLAYGLRALRDRAARTAAEERLRLALEAAQQGIYDLDVRTGQARINAEYATMLGLEPARSTEMDATWIERVHPDDRARVETAYRDYIAGRRPDYRVEFRMRTAGGDWKWILSVGRIVERDAEGQPRRMLGTHIDITERRQAEEALRELAQSLERRVAERTAELQQSAQRAEQASRAKSEFLSRMSHELRTPLNAILGFAQVIEYANPTEQQRAWVQEIRRAGDHLLHLIDELLDLSRIEVGKLSLTIEALPVAPIVRDAIAFVQPELVARDIALRTVEPCHDLATVRVDRVRLRQILVNLLSNAIKYNRPGGSITVACEPLPGERLRLTVTDTGIGIAPDKREQLFRPFERLGAEASGIEGTGIGLALSRQLAHLMGAEIGVDSTPDVGTRFWIDLPLAQAREVAASGAPAAAPLPVLAPEVAGTVLYIEDNEQNLALVRALLETSPQVRLLTALDGVSGLAQARAAVPDLILLDIHMPGMDGFAVLRELRADPATRAIPVIALSADAMPEDIARGKAAGFARYLTKPLRLDALLTTLAELLPGGAVVR